MVAEPIDALQRRSEAIVGNGGDTCDARAVSMEAMPGAGSAPGVTMPSFGVVVAGDHLDRLRSHSMPVIARTRDDLTLLDLRSVDPADDDIVVAALRGVGDASM
jgi:L-seryl-tRNA(Ser) seleniumtransferase